MIKFSIITVCLNAGNDLLETVESTLKQSYDEFEIIVKDGFSKDCSIEKLPQNKKVCVYKEKDKSVYDAMNQAIAYATGDYCLFINAGDTLYEPSTLQLIADFIEKNPGDFYYGKSHTLSSGVMNYGPEKVTKYFCYRTTMCHQAMVIKTSYLKERGYDTQYKITADREWMVYAFVQAKMRFVRMPMVVCNYKGGGISSGEDVRQIIAEETRKINQTHFTKVEQMKFAVMHAITLPGIRSKISSNPRFKSLYYKMRYKYLSR